ncbi:hypothetical protein ACSQ67_023626 [Phaseolus vulgaris]
MLGLSKKDVTAMAKQMKTASHTSPAKNPKMKAVVEAPASEDEDTCSGSVSRENENRPLPSPAQDIIVQESGKDNLQKGGLWDPSLDATSFLEKTLLPVELDNL